MRTLVRILKSLGLWRLLFNKKLISFHPLYPGLQVTSRVCSPRPGYCCHMNSVGPRPTNDSSLEKVWQWFSVLFAEDQAYHWVHQGGHRVGSYQANPSGKELFKKNRLSSKSHYPNCKRGCEGNEKITWFKNSCYFLTLLVRESVKNMTRSCADKLAVVMRSLLDATRVTPVIGTLKVKFGPRVSVPAPLWGLPSFPFNSVFPKSCRKIKI